MHCSASRRNAIPAQNAAIAAEDFQLQPSIQMVTVVAASPCYFITEKILLKQFVCSVISPGRSLNDKVKLKLHMSIEDLDRGCPFLDKQKRTKEKTVQIFAFTIKW